MESRKINSIFIQSLIYQEKNHVDLLSLRSFQKWVVGYQKHGLKLAKSKLKMHFCSKIKMSAVEAVFKKISRNVDFSLWSEVQTARDFPQIALFAVLKYGRFCQYMWRGELHPKMYIQIILSTYHNLD